MSKKFYAKNETNNTNKKQKQKSNVQNLHFAFLFYLNQIFLIIHV